MKAVARALSLRRPRCALFIILFLATFRVFAMEWGHVVDDFSTLDIRVPDPGIVSVDSVDSSLSITVDCTARKPGVIHIPLERRVKDQKLRLYVSNVDGLPYIGKFETTPTGKVRKDSFENYNLEHQKGPTRYSLGDKYYEELSLWFGCRKISGGDTGTARIDRMEIVPLDVTDDRGFVYLLAVILLLAILVPGFLLYCALFEPGRAQHLLIWLTPLSIFSLSLLYLVLVMARYLWPGPDFGVLLPAYGMLTLGLVAWLAVKSRLRTTFSELASIKWELLALVVVMLGVAAVISENLKLPLYTLTHGHMRYLTYGAFGAHDMMFQYVNGIAVLHDEPFSKYYGNYKLLYHVQDRSVFGGVLYAVARGMAAPIHMELAYSYGFYTLFGSVLNVLVLLPVFALHRYFFTGTQRPWLILLLICASAFLVTNFYLTWFKLAGAGLVISGIVLLLLEGRRARYWVIAGVLWGLAANFHPSLALSFPVVTLWLLYRLWRARDKRLLPIVLAFAGLMGAFVVMLMPWQIIKASHYEDTNKLFREHFLASEPYDEEQGITGSISSFAGRYTLAEQLATRYQRFAQSLRVEEVKVLAGLAWSGNWLEFLRKWNLVEAAYTIYVFVPLVVMLCLSGLLARWLPAASWSGPLTRHAGDFRALLATQVLSIVLIIIGTYGKNDPDLTWNMPMSSLVIVLYLLVHANIAVGRIGLALITTYALLTYYRLFFQYF